MAFNERQLKIIEHKNLAGKDDAPLGDLQKQVMGIKRSLVEKEKIISRKNRHAERFNKTLEEKKKESIEKVIEQKILKDIEKKESLFQSDAKQKGAVVYKKSTNIA